MTTRVLIPSGVLGLGFDRVALERGIRAKPDIICIDGGSTDSGAFYLGTSSSKYARSVCKSEWRDLMLARALAGVPLVIGSCGTCGSNDTVDWMYDITLELAAELCQSLKITRIYSQQSSETIKRAHSSGRLSPLTPAPKIDDVRIDACTNIVALAGIEQIGAALTTGADIVLAGRTTDTATISALPIMRGEHSGASWHGAKIGECGAFCSSKPSSGVIVIDFDKQGFTVEAMAEGANCTPHSVSAHMLYENTDPFILYEPGGHLDVSGARYTALDDRRVRVEGSQWHKSLDYRVKLEAARIDGYQTTMLALIRDSRYVENSTLWVENLAKFCEAKISECTNFARDDYSLDFRLIGTNASLGALENKKGYPVEVGVLLIITASSQAIANELSQIINPFLLHYPLTDDEELPTFAFPYSPAHCERGAIYEFALNHLLELDEPMDGFVLQTNEVNYR